MERVHKAIHSHKVILVLDYSGLRPGEMLAVMEEAMNILVHENEPRLILVKFDDKSFISPAFMRRAEQINKKHGHLILNQAFVGLSVIKTFILKGFNLFLGKDYKSFDSNEEAIRYLLADAR